MGVGLESMRMASRFVGERMQSQGEEALRGLESCSSASRALEVPQRHYIATTGAMDNPWPLSRIWKVNAEDRAGLLIYLRKSRPQRHRQGGPKVINGLRITPCTYQSFPSQYGTYCIGK